MKTLRWLVVVVMALTMVGVTMACDNPPPAVTPTGNPFDDIEPDQVDLGRATNTNAPPTDAEKASLIYAREEQKVARDLYQQLGEKWLSPVLASNAQAEQKHFDAVKTLLDRFGMTDPARPAAGQFTDPVLQKMYASLLERGGRSLVEAFNAAAYMEEAEIGDTGKFVEYANRLDIIRGLGTVYAEDRSHLRAYVAELKKLGVDYQPQLLSRSDFDNLMRPVQ